MRPSPFTCPTRSHAPPYVPPHHAVILTLEVVRDMGLPTVVPLNQPPAPMEPEEEGAEEGAAAAAAAQEQQQQQQQQQQLGGQRPPVGLAPGFMLACDPGKGVERGYRASLGRWGLPDGCVAQPGLLCSPRFGT